MKQIDDSQKPLKKSENTIFPSSILDINYGFVRSRILHSALELSLFTIISQGKNTINDIVSITSFDKKGLEKLMNALLGMGLLTKKKDRFELTDISRKYLVEGDNFLGDHLKEIMKQWDRWSNLTNIVKSGEKVSLSENFGKGIISDLFPLLFPTAQKIVNRLNLPLNLKVLDIEPGSGEWGIALALRGPNTSVTAQKNNHLTKRVDSFKLDKQFEYVNTSSEIMNQVRKFDLVIISHSFRFDGDDQNKEKLRKIKKILKPNGQILLVDALINDEETGPSIGFLLDLSMFVNTSNGRVRQENEYVTWLKEIGFKNIEIIKSKPYPILLAGGY